MSFIFSWLIPRGQLTTGVLFKIAGAAKLFRMSWLPPMDSNHHKLIQSQLSLQLASSQSACVGERIVARGTLLQNGLCGESPVNLAEMMAGWPRTPSGGAPVRGLGEGDEFSRSRMKRLLDYGYTFGYRHQLG